MTVLVQFDIPTECNKWLKHHNGSLGTRSDWRTVIHNLFGAFLEDIQADYEAQEHLDNP